ncbi:MAG: T9SS type A sorting domain-containing protein [Paludibacteraceae bacterium]|nr:T9SS type A sorting domain-containing protein [Paludibacteraceae bacterium]
MKKRRLIICVLLCGTMITWAASVQNLTVQAKGGTKSTYALSSVRKITFTGTTMSVVKTDATETDFTINSVQKLLFSSSSTSAIKEASNTALKAYPNPAKGIFNIDGISKIDNISLYNLAGNELIVSYSLVNNGVQINTANLAQGLYLLRINNQTIKFQKQ